MRLLPSGPDRVGEAPVHRRSPGTCLTRFRGVGARVRLRTGAGDAKKANQAIGVPAGTKPPGGFDRRSGWRRSVADSPAMLRIAIQRPIGGLGPCKAGVKRVEQSLRGQRVETEGGVSYCQPAVVGGWGQNGTVRGTKTDRSVGCESAAAQDSGDEIQIGGSLQQRRPSGYRRGVQVRVGVERDHPQIARQRGGVPPTVPFGLDMGDAGLPAGLVVAVHPTIHQPVAGDPPRAPASTIIRQRPRMWRSPLINVKCHIRSRRISRRRE